MWTLECRDLRLDFLKPSTILESSLACLHLTHPVLVLFGDETTYFALDIVDIFVG